MALVESARKMWEEDNLPLLEAIKKAAVARAGAAVPPRSFTEVFNRMKGQAWGHSKHKKTYLESAAALMAAETPPPPGAAASTVLAGAPAKIATFFKKKEPVNVLDEIIDGKHDKMLGLGQYRAQCPGHFVGGPGGMSPLGLPAVPPADAGIAPHVLWAAEIDAQYDMDNEEAVAWLAGPVPVTAAQTASDDISFYEKWAGEVDDQYKMDLEVAEAWSVQPAALGSGATFPPPAPAKKKLPAPWWMSAGAPASGNSARGKAGNPGVASVRFF